MVEREGDRVVIEGGVGRGVVGRYRRLGKTGDHLLDVAYALHTGDWRAKGRVIPCHMNDWIRAMKPKV